MISIRTLVLSVAVLLVSSFASAEAEPPRKDPCVEVAAIDEHLAQLQTAFDAVAEEAEPVCKAKDKPRCRRLLAELEELKRDLRRTADERRPLAKACDEQRKAAK